MPGEEMEITTDFGHAGFGDDIDIDLDFTMGQHDEDMELGDFDQAQEMQNFNSDTRDELMAEVDDASYGMVDADDVEHNVAAAAANDIEIDLGDSDENQWQRDVAQAENFENVVEIGGIDMGEAVNVDDANAENVGNREDNFSEVSAYPNNNEQPEEAGTADVDVIEVGTTSDDLLLDNTAPTTTTENGVASQEFGVSEAGENNAEPSNVGDNADGGVEGGLDTSLEEQRDPSPPHDSLQGLANRTPLIEEQDRHGNNNDAESNGYAAQGDNTHETYGTYETHEDEQYQTNRSDTPEIGYDQDDEPLEHEEAPATVALSHESTVEHFSENREEEEQVGQPDLSGLEGAEHGHRLGSNSHAGSTNGYGDNHDHEHESNTQAPREEGAEDPSTADEDNQSEAYDAENGDREAVGAGEEEKPAHALTPHVEHPLSIATRHEVFISYGRTDYRLFAKSDADDPNTYFLSDMSALEFSLGQFLSSLREVIADEVSPLDELVMHVDGLGLEFSESSATDMLEEFTFGDILGLYDRLVKNDGADPAPELYTYLLVRPNCRQRLMALLDSADAGRGLSEIAVYREVTPGHDNQDGNPDGQSPYVSPQDDENEDEGAYGYEDYPPAEEGIDQHNDGEEAEGNDASNSPSAQSPAAGERIEGLTDHVHESEEEDDNDVGDDNDLNGLFDDELDLSSVKQDQQANAPPRDHAYDTAQEEREISAAAELDGTNQHTFPTNGAVDPPNSDITSATATLNGDDKDEIDYSDDDGDEIVDGKSSQSNSSGAPTAPNAPIDDEITWESDDEDAKNEPTTAPKETVQVSPTSGKRARSDSDLDEGVTEQNDVKRRRPS